MTETEPIPAWHDERPFDRAGAADFLRWAQGLLCLFWGMGLGLLLFFQALHIPFLELLPVPPYLLGVVLAGRGWWMLREGHAAGPAWRRNWGLGLAALGLLAYLAPFVRWWTRVPYQSYLLMHLFLLMLASLALLFAGSRLALRLGGLMGDRGFETEARLCSWLMPAMAVLEMGFLLVALVQALRHDTGLYTECFRMLYHLPSWIHIGALLPFSLTMACVWKARRLCLEQLLRPAHESV